MPIFRDRVAQEACPAKTAESVSYWATFAVLGWLLIGNFSGFGDGNTDGSPTAVAAAEVASDTTQSSPAASMLSEYVEPSSTILLATTMPSSPPLTQETEPPKYSQLAELASWHSDLGLARQAISHSGTREFSIEGWSSHPKQPMQLGEPFAEDLSLPLPLIDTDFLFRPVTGPELASVEGNNAGPIHEITITGTEPTRLTTRPDNIRRPQLPRPYRAQEVQRSLVLPPRIQALRP